MWQIHLNVGNISVLDHKGEPMDITQNLHNIYAGEPLNLSQFTISRMCIFNHYVMKRREYFLYGNKTKMITILFENFIYLFIQNILNCVLKTNKAFTSSEQHGGK